MRQSPKGVFCDGIQKILIPDRPSHTAVVITGNITLREMPDLATQELCEFLATTPAPIDFGRTTLNFLNSEGTRLANFDGQKFTDAIHREIHPYLAAGNLRAFLGTRVAQIIIADFDPATGAHNILAFGIDIDLASQLKLQPLSVTHSTTLSGTTFGQDDRPTVLPFGEVPYFNTHVLSGLGRTFLGAEYSQLLQKQKVSEIEPELASTVALNLIHVTSKTTETIPAPSGIGGGASAVLVGVETIFLK
jgi:hypothetical protein